jgi:hypothetical protein
MTTAATCETGALARSEIITCISQLRAVAVLLAGDRQRADDLGGDDRADLHRGEVAS